MNEELTEIEQLRETNRRLNRSNDPKTHEREESMCEFELPTLMHAETIIAEREEIAKRMKLNPAMALDERLLRRDAELSDEQEWRQMPSDN